MWICAWFMHEGPDVVMSGRAVHTAIEDKTLCFPRGLEDVKVSCAHIHSEHSRGLTKALQDYRYLSALEFYFIYLFDELKKRVNSHKFTGDKVKKD